MSHTASESPSAPQQLWKRADALANKSGACQTVYWVAPKPSTSYLRSLPGAAPPASALRSKRRFLCTRSYKGEWRDNLKHGFGVEKLSDGSVYEGRFQLGQRCGEGSLFVTQTAGKGSGALVRTYTGQWRAGKRDGIGVYWYADGSRYEGNWAAGLRHGCGSLFFANGDTHTGSWDRGEQSGFGSLVKAASGDVYEGMYVRGRREGQGMYFYCTQQQVFDGDWVNDQPVTGVVMAARDFFMQQATDTAADGGGNFALSRPSSAAMLRVARTSLISASAAGPMPLPALRLSSPDAVLSSQLERVSLHRSPIRSLSSLPPLSTLYSQDELLLMRAVWDALRTKREKEGESEPGGREVLKVEDVEGWLRQVWTEALRRKGRLSSEEVRRALREMGKGADQQGWKDVQGEREEATVRDVTGCHDSSVAGFDTCVLVVWLVEQGRVVGQAVREEERKKRLEEATLSAAAMQQRTPRAAASPERGSAVQEEKEQISVAAASQTGTEATIEEARTETTADRTQQEEG